MYTVNHEQLLEVDGIGKDQTQGVLQYSHSTVYQECQAIIERLNSRFQHYENIWCNRIEIV